ncbi:unnamed protein product [Lactuca saligna]|uniref:Uncharacterized protein n=1 Tax=Lactuca saligna TaxID=75948 RepID=A0AA36EF48_LACSI|nr:unnamed protein product [Lactuca saligna]
MTLVFFKSQLLTTVSPSSHQKSTTNTTIRNLDLECRSPLSIVAALTAPTTSPTIAPPIAVVRVTDSVSSPPDIVSSRRIPRFISSSVFMEEESNLNLVLRLHGGDLREGERQSWVYFSEQKVIVINGSLGLYAPSSTYA